MFTYPNNFEKVSKSDSISGKSNSEKYPFGCGCFLIFFISIFASYSVAYLAGDNSEKAQAASKNCLKNAELVDYRNHKYIVFSISGNKYAHATQSVVHDPDCPCDEN